VEGSRLASCGAVWLNARQKKFANLCWGGLLRRFGEKEQQWRGGDKVQQHLHRHRYRDYRKSLEHLVAGDQMVVCLHLPKVGELVKANELEKELSHCHQVWGSVQRQTVVRCAQLRESP
jgi:hypothetical protein